MTDANTCVGTCEIKPNGTPGQQSSQAMNNPLPNSGNQNISTQANTKSIMRSSLITTKNFNKDGSNPGPGTTLQVRQLTSKFAKPPVAASPTSTVAKMINLQSPLVTSGPSTCPSTGSGDASFLPVGGNPVNVSTAVTTPVGQATVPLQSSISNLVGAAAQGTANATTIKGFKTVMGGHAVQAGKMDTSTRFILNSAKPPMTVNLTPNPSGTGSKVRFAPLVNIATAGHSLSVATEQHSQHAQHKVILQQANQIPAAGGAVVVSTTKVQSAGVTISSAATAVPTHAGSGSASIRLSLPRRVGTQQPGSQTVLPQQQGSGARIVQTCGIVTTSAGGATLPNLAPRMVLASTGPAASASVMPVHTSTTASVQNLQHSLTSPSQGSALTVSQHDLQRLQQSGAIAPVVTPSTSAGGTSVLTVRNVNTANTGTSVPQSLNTPNQQTSGVSSNSTIEQALMMATPPSFSALPTTPNQSFISRKRPELGLTVHHPSSLNEGGQIPSRIITLHQTSQPSGSAQQITLQANMTVAAHVTSQTASQPPILTQQVQQLVQQQQVLQPGPVRPEASNSPMRKRARKQQLQTVATPVTTPMTVEEEEEQKRNNMYMMTVAADRHAMSRLPSGSQSNSQSTGLSATSSSHNPSPGSVADPVVSSVRLGSRSELVGTLEVTSGTVGSHAAMSTPVTGNITSSNRYRANSAQSSSSSSGRSTPRLVTSHHRKRHSPRSQGSVAAKLSRKAVLHTAGSRSSSRRNRSNKVVPSSSNTLVTGSTSDTESDVEAAVSVVGVRDNVCISNLLSNDDFHSPPTVTSSVRFGSSPLPQEQHLIISSNSSRRPQSSLNAGLRKRIQSSQSGMRSCNLPSHCVRQSQPSSVSYSQSSKQSIRRISCEREADTQMEEDTVLEDDLEVDTIEEEVEAAEDEEIWCVNEESGDLSLIGNVSGDDRYLSPVTAIQQRYGTSPDMSTVGANVAVSSTDISEMPDNGVMPSISEVSDGGSIVVGCRRMSILKGYHVNWKPRNNHYQSHSDVRERKNDKKNALINLVVSSADKKKISTMHWEVLCLLTSFANMISIEKEKLKKLEKVSENLRQAKNAPDVLKELVKGNLQRSQLMIETITGHYETLEKFVTEQSKDMSLFLAPLELFCSSNASPSNSSFYSIHSRNRHPGVGGSNCNRTGSGAHRNLS